MSNTYEEFLAQKAIVAEPCGFDVAQDTLNAALYPFQRDAVQWGLRRGRAAMFEDCGLGKTLQQCDWARCIVEHTGKAALIVAPLAVSKQTVAEAAKFGIVVHDTRRDDGVPEIREGATNITNYQQIHKFDPADFSALVLDESSILKGFSGQYRKLLTEFAQQIPFRLAATATPAPNDIVELCTHSEFLGVMTEREVKAMFFRLDNNSSHEWRLKGHAQDDFWRWLASWCVAIRKPSDLGYDDGDFILPPLNVENHIVESTDSGNYLFPMEAITLQERREARRNSMPERVAMAASLANGDDGQWLVWCDLNAESQALTKAIRGAVQVTGSDKDEHKESAMLGFSRGEVRVLVTKPSIAGHGMNWQNCQNAVFVGLSDSWESYYQAVRRCWRFGQAEQVNVHIVTAGREGAVLQNILRKDEQASAMMKNVVAHMKGLNMVNAEKDTHVYTTDESSGPGWEMMLGDSVERIKGGETESVGLSVFSPPFPGMYAYTNSDRDMGNVKNMAEMIEGYAHLVPELLRVVKPGRSCCVHLCQGVAFLGADGYIGIKDFRGQVIQTMEAGGWVYYGEVCIDKDPQVKAIRTKDAGLLFKSLARDSSRMHMALADYILQFRKPGDNTDPIKAGTSERYDNQGWISADEWIEWAAPVWYRQTKDYPGGIRETDVLNTREGKGEDDEKHICPLQLGVIERCVKLWSNPGDLVLSPFAGIGSEGYVSLKFNRRFVGCELKPEYYEVAKKNMGRAIADRDQPDLVDMAMAAGE